MTDGQKRRALLTELGPPLLVLLGLLATWQIVFSLRLFEPILLPSPASVFRAFREQPGKLFGAMGLTALAAAAGFFCSLIVGVLSALLFSQSRLVRNGFYPYTIFLQTVPIVAIAPIIINLFGYGLHSVVLVATIISVFPIIASGTQGLINVPDGLVDLFRVYGATNTQILFKLRLPHAVHYLLTGARTSAGLAVVGAIVGEFFAGYTTDQRGLGYVILNSKNLYQIDVSFAAILLSTLLGILTFASITFVSKTVLRRWATVA